MDRLLTEEQWHLYEGGRHVGRSRSYQQQEDVIMDRLLTDEEITAIEVSCTYPDYAEGSKGFRIDWEEFRLEVIDQLKQGKMPEEE